MFHFTLDMGIYGGIGFVVGAFCPAVGRAIKTWLTKEVTAAQADLEAKVVAEVKKIKSQV